MAEDKKSSLSFGFTKKKEPKVLNKAAIEDEEKQPEEETDFIGSFDQDELKRSKQKEEKKELVIPLIESNKWRRPKRPDELEETAPEKEEKLPVKDGQAKDDIDSQAVKELLQDAAARNEDWEARGGKRDAGRVVPLLMQNKVPDGFETDDKLNVELRPDEASAADYDAVPIEEYGMAMLRGMGWKKDVGIGKTVQGTFTPIQAVPRPKGLGLGADRSSQKQAKHTSDGAAEGGEKDEKQELVMKAGTHCQVTSGKHNDKYGIIQGLDEENARAVVKLTLGGDVISLNQGALKLVSEKEYSKYSKYLNKGKVDKYKEKQDKKHKHNDSEDESHRKHHKHKHSDRDDDREHRRERREDKKDRHRNRKDKHRDSDHSDHSDSEKRRRSKKRSRSRSRDRDAEEKRNRKEKKRKHEDNSKGSDKKHKTQSNGKPPVSPWLRPHLKVRVIDPEFSKGKYFKVKVTVEDVISLDECICRTEEGKVLEGLTQGQLETVIPKSDPAHVMVVHGKHRGQVGEIVKKDKASCTAAVQLLRDRDTLLTLDYDVICEYTGDIQSEFDY